ncbi:MAG: synthase subunit gamma [Gammaproteobacteria bacterium]|jgi:F-type H+-transporting ATPase subunit gamma|nr:synthase subunit gamma [Gammaproteobacteria bacterium]
MASLKETRVKIDSVKKTQKITKAMELVAASKMRKAQERMNLSKPYATKILEVIGHLANAHPEYRHVYFKERTVKRVGFIIVTSDRGLCGGLNNNLLKLAVQKMREAHADSIEVDLCLIGSKAASFFRRANVNVVASANHLGDAPQVQQLIGVIEVMLSAYREGKLDKLVVFRNEFVNTMTQKPLPQQLLPLVHSDDKSKVHHWDYIYEPDPRELIDALLQRYIESQVYEAVIENLACEQASRMVAMKSATDNAGSLIDDLKLVYNKARQAAITQEISEIVSGAAAV